MKKMGIVNTFLGHDLQNGEIKEKSQLLPFTG